MSSTSRGRKGEQSAESDEPRANQMKGADAHSGAAGEEANVRIAATLQSQARVRRLRGKVQWEGDLDASRTDRSPER